MEASANQWKAEKKKAIITLFIWTFLWVLSMALVTFGPIFLWEKEWITLASLGLNVGLAVIMAIANVRHIRLLDELDRRITYEAMAIALGVGVFGGLAYSVMDITNLISSDAEIGFLVMAISITYIIAMVIGKMRYK